VQRIRVHRPGVRCERPRHEVLPPDPRDPMWSGPRHSLVPVVAPAEEQPGSHIPSGRALLAALTLASGIYNVCRDGERVSNRRFSQATGWNPEHYGETAGATCAGHPRRGSQTRSPCEARASACGGIIAPGTSRPWREIQGNPGSEAGRLTVVRCQREAPQLRLFEVGDLLVPVRAQPGFWTLS
jgi:hypothetical protein